MPVEQFDQSDDGWRRVGEKRGCESAGAALIAAYLARHPRLSATHRAQLLWHRGQLLALAGRSRDALAIFGRIHDSDRAQHWYRAATIAFLRRDRSGLMTARSRLAVLPKPSDFDDAARRYRAQTGEDLVWPFNLGVVDALIRCFASDYRTAYADACAR